MQVSKLSLFIPALMLVSAGAFADQSAIPPQGYPPPAQDYYPPPQAQGYPPPQAYQNPCNQCGAPQLPDVYPLPGPGFDPGAQYYCDPYQPCPQPILPYGPPPVLYAPPLPPPLIVQPSQPYYGRPIWPRYNNARPFLGYPSQRFGGPIGVGPRPGFGRPGFPVRGGRPFHHISAQSCEVQQGNNGQFSVISPDGQTIYSNSSAHAQENAEAMKSYYEKSLTGLCGTIQKSNDTLDI
jgi:hypothetical protein